MAYELGVDLGTTFSTVAILRDGHIEMADLGAHSFAVPSVLYIGPDARVLVGEAARRRAATDPTLVVREVKRRLGDTAPMLVGDTAYSPALLTAALLRGVVSRVVRAEGGPPRRINLAHPANWGSFRREVFAEAATLAGIETEFSFIIEPVAAAVWHARHERVPTGAVVAVYDLGGGTFDAAVLRKTEESFEVLGEPSASTAWAGSTSTRPSSASSTAVSTVRCSASTRWRSPPPASCERCVTRWWRPRRRSPPTSQPRSTCRCRRASRRCASPGGSSRR
ncbi:MAG: Hsp70 family protein [Acidimicrobiales bacterium]